ncbi:MAG TPA: hypothetical protein VF859_13385 [Burkholderiales bacterium]
MTLTASDLKRLRWPLLLLVAVGAAGAGGIYASQKFAEGQRAGTRNAESKAGEARNRVRSVTSEKQELLAVYPQYRSLAERGIIGPDRRLDWVETVETLGRKHGLFSVTYNMEAQKPLEAPAAAAARAGFDVNVSRMTLAIEALHEGQLLDFLNAIKTESQGLTLIEGCSLTRIGTGRELRYAPQIAATCSLGWVTLREKKGA